MLLILFLFCLSLVFLGFGNTIKIIFEFAFEERVDDKEAERDELLKRATAALEKNAAEEVPFWRANK